MEALWSESSSCTVQNLQILSRRKSRCTSDPTDHLHSPVQLVVLVASAATETGWEDFIDVALEDVKSCLHPEEVEQLWC